MEARGLEGADARHLYQANDFIALAMGTLAAQRLDPERLVRFKRYIETQRLTLGDNAHLRSWTEIVRRGPVAVRQAFTEPSQRGQVLRSVISFRAFISKTERDEIFRQHMHGAGAGR